MNTRSQLSKVAANHAAHRLMHIKDAHVLSLDVKTAENCLPSGWALHNVTDQDLQPCTVTDFVRLYRTHAVYVPPPPKVV